MGYLKDSNPPAAELTVSGVQNERITTMCVVEEL